MNRLTIPQGEFDLTRFPEDPRDQFRAWNAADEYLLRHLHENVASVDLTGTVVVLGDRWGALATALAAHRPAQITDSYLTQQATLANLARSGAPAGAVRLLSTRDTPPERIDVLLVHVPKSLALLEDQLHRLAPRLHPGSTVIGTGMVTEIHTSTLNLFDQIIGPTRTSLAVKKARLIFAVPAADRPRGADPWPKSHTLPDGAGPASGHTVVNHAGVFSAERLDIGTRFLLNNLPPIRGRKRVVDLGCGNGVVGLAAALAGPDAEILLVDESYQALASAEATFRANAQTRAEFHLGDGLTGIPPASVDLILNNPPFHSHRATSDATAWRMFTASRTALRPGGELRVVGNRHLGYHVKLRRLFGNCDVVAANPKFVILRAVKT
ncbi:16S rRNA (guanine1207-N2)-methyltransferase [Sinosporangium album]|uniref:16S rRNA (Guanine1207-N2)-methyltransferase n=1 Tax=Sinosporangium album TaxID=504805 RepID=A0A1G8G397_9ACTN|nr:methyltransferase [Sinosporangium album]SDH88852.1 16S rRNA (guanine1207-N2)-methyltransferase [Sinosporangium album]